MADLIEKLDTEHTDSRYEEVIAEKINEIIGIINELIITSSKE